MRQSRVHLSLNKKASTSLEQKVRTYFYAFGGPSRDFSNIEDLFDDIYHEEIQLMEEDGQIYTREHLQKYHAYFLENLGCLADLIEFHWLSRNRAEIKFVVFNEEVEILIHIIATVKDGKIVKQRPFDRSLGASSQHSL